MSRFLQLIENDYSESFYDDYDRIRDDVMDEWYSGKKHQSWTLVPRNKLVRLYQEHGKYGRVNEGLLLDVWSILQESVIKVIINSESRHGDSWPYGDEPDLNTIKKVAQNPTPDLFNDLPSEERERTIPFSKKRIEQLKDKMWNRWFLFISDLSGSTYFRNFGEVKGNARYSDASQGLTRLLTNCYSADTPEAKLFAIDKILNFVHGLGPMAKWLIEGGTSTLDEIFKFSPEGIKGNMLR